MVEEIGGGDLFKKKWKNYRSVGSSCFVLGKKIKMLKEDLKRWNGKELGNVAVHKTYALKQIRNVDDN